MNKDLLDFVMDRTVGTLESFMESYVETSSAGELRYIVHTSIRDDFPLMPSVSMRIVLLSGVKNTVQSKELVTVEVSFLTKKNQPERILTNMMKIKVYDHRARKIVAKYDVRNLGLDAEQPNSWTYCAVQLLGAFFTAPSTYLKEDGFTQ